MTPALPTSDVDLWADDVLVDPSPAFAELRELGPVVHLPGRDLYALTRYDAVKNALADPGAFSSVGAIGFNPDVNGALQGTSLASDPPEHTQLRAALGAGLNPKALRGLRETITDKADRLVADLARRGDFEAIDALAREFPIEIVADLIGFRGEVKDNMLRWGEAAMTVLGPMNQRTIESFPIAGELYGWCSTVSADDLAPGSVGRGIFEAESRGEIPEGSSGHIIHQYLGAGVDSTVASIGNIVALFGRHPEQFELVRADPALVPAAFAEVLRYWHILHAWGRRATRDLDIEGSVIPAGSHVAILFGAANRDPRHYEHPDVFDIRRNPSDHLMFGYGPHSCAGQNLARMEAHAVIAALATRLESFRTDGERREPSNTTQSLSSLRVFDVVAA